MGRESLISADFPVVSLMIRDLTPETSSPQTSPTAIESAKAAIFPNNPMHGTAAVEPSVGCVCDSFDTVLAETMLGLSKSEGCRSKGPWRNVEEAEFETLEWADCCNNRRLLEAIGDIP